MSFPSCGLRALCTTPMLPRPSSFTNSRRSVRGAGEAGELLPVFSMVSCIVAHHASTRERMAKSYPQAEALRSRSRITKVTASTGGRPTHLKGCRILIERESTLTADRTGGFHKNLHKNTARITASAFESPSRLLYPNRRFPIDDEVAHSPFSVPAGFPFSSWISRTGAGYRLF